MFVKPRPYQQDIINKTLGTTKSTLIQLPTGGGKTIISKEIAIGLINNFNKKILFIAPKIVLMDQTLETFKGLKPQKVHGSNNKFDKDHHILISTLQTASRRNSLNPDVIIIDEVHFGYEKKMLNKIMEYNKNARIIGLSATPYDENGYPLKGFAVILNDYDLTYMIKRKYLVPLRSFVLVKPDLSNVSIIAGDYELNQLSEAVSKNTIIMEIVTTSKPYIEKSIKTIVFAVDINHAELLKTAFQNEGFITESIHSKSEVDDNEVIERFKKGYIKVLVSVLKLTTGFDVPETDLAIIARPTKSQNLYKQMVGRVLRTVDFEKTGINKKYAILLDCGNVIENLGKPLDPIIPKDELEKKIQKFKCKHCESENIKLKKSKSKMYWECKDCGCKKDLENKNYYKCKNCNEKYSYENGEFELVNNKLYLNCECGFETEISIATGDEEFREVDSGIKIIIDNKENKINFLSFDKAREYVRNSNIRSKRKWMAIKNNKDFPHFLPKDPDRFYKGLWISWENWFGKEKIKVDDKYYTYENAKKYLKQKKIDSKETWELFCNSDDFPNFLPKNPDLIYKNIGWINFEDFLNVKEYFPFNEARKFVKSLNFKNIKEWDNYKNMLDSQPESKFIPKEPELIYKNNGWISFENWLGIEEPRKDYLSYEEAKKIVKKMRISDVENWYYVVYNSEYNFSKKIPKHPDEIYINNGWISWDDWLGKNKTLESNKKNNQKYLDFYQAREIIRKLNLSSEDKYYSFRLNNNDDNYKHIPKFPDEYYKDTGWISWNDWLGKIVPLSFEDQKKFVRSLKLNSQSEWDKYTANTLTAYCKFPSFIFKNPSNSFYKQWVNIEDWLGIDILTYEFANKFVKNLNLGSYHDWTLYRKNQELNLPRIPSCIPQVPSLAYKNNGWTNWDKWLGTQI